MASTISGCTFLLLSRAAHASHGSVDTCTRERLRAMQGIVTLVSTWMKRIQSEAPLYAFRGRLSRSKNTALTSNQRWTRHRLKTQESGKYARVCVLPCVYSVRLSETQLCDEESGYNPARGTTHWPACQHVPLSLPPSLSRHPCVCECVAIPYKASQQPQSFREMENKEGPKRDERRQMKRERRAGGGVLSSR